MARRAAAGATLAAARPGRRAGLGAGWDSLIDRVIPLLGSLLLAVVFLHAHAVRVQRPLAPVAANNWFGWSDQGLYLRATQAWLRGDMAVAEHAYMPGYPLLGLPFLVHVPWLGLPLADPFLPADLACLIASLWALRAIAIRLAPRLRYAGALGALVFVAIMLGSPPALDVWVVPWSSSPATPCLLLCLWAALRFHADFPARTRAAGGGLGRPGRWSLLAGAAGAMVGAFRPTDMMVALVPAALLIAATLLIRRAAWGDWLRTAAAGAAGVLAVFALIAVFYVPIYGWGPSPYMIGAARCGFEWGLLPLRWVTLMLDPRPLLPDGRGLISAFPWFLSGLGGGLALILLPGRAARLPYVVVGGAFAFHTALYLCYRDIHSGALWLYFNYHYFKWVVPVAGLLTVLWLATVVSEKRHRRVRLALGVCAAAALLPWRAELRPVADAAAAPHWQSDGSLLIPQGLHDLSDAVVYAAQGSWDDMFMGRARLDGAAESFQFNNDYKTIPAGGGDMLVPLRPLPASPLTLRIEPPRLVVDRGIAPVAARQRIVLGLPCLLRFGRDACLPDMVLAAPLVPLGTTLRFSEQHPDVFLAGWWNAEPQARWTLGPLAALRFRIDPARLGDRALALAFVARPFLPPGSRAIRVRALVGGRQVAHWRLTSPDTATLRALVPSALLNGDGGLTLRLEIEGYGSPAQAFKGSTDWRPLGLFVETMTVDAAAP